MKTRCVSKKKKFFHSSEKEHTPIARRVSQRAWERAETELINTGKPNQEAKPSERPESPSLLVRFAQGQRPVGIWCLQAAFHPPQGRGQAQKSKAPGAENVVSAPPAAASPCLALLGARGGLLCHIPDIWSVTSLLQAGIPQINADLSGQAA